MRARDKRNIRSGKEYDPLFPEPSRQDISVRKDADVEDTMSLIRKTVSQTLWHTEKIARKLKGNDLDSTCSNIWHFVYGHIQYKRDKAGVEQVRSPRRTWWERHNGVDCDCYTEFISSILSNLRIPHKARITKYPKRPPEVSYWQHVYPVVPRDGQLDKDLSNRRAYIVLDCVKDEFDAEEPFLERKDYDMKLDYLDGIEEQEPTEETEDFSDLLGLDTSDPENVDLADLAAIYDDEEMGNIFKKIGKGLKKVVSKVKEGVRFLNRYTNPATILLRNGFLLAMKVNLMNAAGRLRYAYLTDVQAKALGINIDSLNKLRKVKDRAETIYWQAGGKKENLKKAILKGKGNKDHKVSMSGLDGLDDVYADLDEYNIIHSDTNGLGELGIVGATALAAATSAVAAIAGALKQIKGLFSKGGKEEQSFQSETDNAGSASSISEADASSKDESQILDQPESQNESTSNSQSTITVQSDETIQPGESISPLAPQTAKSLLPTTTSASRRITTGSEEANQNSSVPATTNNQEGLIQKTTSWVKQNPGKSLLVAGGVIGGTILLVKAMQGNKHQGVSGLPKKKGKKNKGKTSKSKSKVERIIF